MWTFLFFCLAYVILLGKYSWAGGVFLYIILGVIVIVILRCIFSSLGRGGGHGKSDREKQDEIDYDNDNYLTRRRIEQNRKKQQNKK